LLPALLQYSHQSVLKKLKHPSMKLFSTTLDTTLSQCIRFGTLSSIKNIATIQLKVSTNTKPSRPTLLRLKHITNLNPLTKKGLNHLSDMTAEEVKSYYNIKPMNVQRLRKGLRNLSKFNLDDYNEEEESSSTQSVKEIKNVDYRDKMRPVRNQGNCGSCWAFATHAILEGFYQIQVGALKDHFSTQQSVDCDTRNGGCNGGWYEGALAYFQTNQIMYEADYPYKALRGTCAYDANKGTGKKITGYSTYYSEDGAPEEKFISLLNQGPVAIAVAVDNQWFQYKSGIFSGNCVDGVNHAVVAVGYNAGGKCTGAHFIVRNSWGASWGEEGHIRIAYSIANKRSCNVESLDSLAMDLNKQFLAIIFNL